MTLTPPSPIQQIAVAILFKTVFHSVNIPTSSASGYIRGKYTSQYCNLHAALYVGNMLAAPSISFRKDFLKNLCNYTVGDMQTSYLACK